MLKKKKFFNIFFFFYWIHFNKIKFNLLIFELKSQNFFKYTGFFFFKAEMFYKTPKPNNLKHSIDNYQLVKCF